METLTIKVHLSARDYVKVSYHLFYRKFSGKFMTGLGIFMLVTGIYLLIVEGTLNWFPMLFGVFLVGWIPIQIHLSAKKNYRANKRIQEEMTYIFNSDTIQVVGESFNSQLSWDKLYAITENNSWLLIWLNKQVANVIPKQAITESQLAAFRLLASHQKGFKNKLQTKTPANNI